MGTVYAQHSCAVGQPNGGIIYLTKGKAYEADHPAVKAKPHLFGPELPGVASVDAPDPAVEESGEDRPQKRQSRRSGGG